jgi:subtilisin family serine protease
MSCVRERLWSLALVLAVAACGGGDGNNDPGPDPDPDPTIADTLVAAAGSPAVAAIPRLQFEPDSTEYDLGHPELGGLPHSVRTAIVSFAPDATVGAVNALLQQLDAEIAGGIPGVAGLAPGLLALRLPTTTHEAMEAALATLRASAAVRLATQDVLLGYTEVTSTSAASASIPAGSGFFTWTWDPTGRDVPAMATWGLAAIRMPQAWNLNAQIRARGGNAPRTGVLDAGFLATHPDLQGVIEIDLIPGCGVSCDHGTHVAGTIGARHGDARGVEGVNPFARLVVRQVNNSTSSFAAVVWGLDDLIVGGAPLRVVNLSLAYNWYLSTPVGSYDPRVADGFEQNRANEDGEIVKDLLAAVQAGGIALPVILAAAGNDGDQFPGAEARFLSPFNNAALEQGVAAIVVVEADSTEVRPAASPSYGRASYSGIGGHISAPGTKILSAVDVAPFHGVKSGTSMATPHVSGLVGFLYSLDPTLPAPTLTTNLVRDVLVNSSRRVDGAPYNGRPMIDAFAAALALDSARGNDVVLRLLIDIDDGTDDGNTRIDPFDKAVVATDDPLADATIDMADFRRWRDMVLATELPLITTLDGAATNPKKDRNGDGVVGTDEQERISPRGDFNGDGRLSRTAIAVVPGLLSPRGGLTDLEVLEARFADPVYRARELASLVVSGDVHANILKCVPLTGERIRMRVSGGGFVKERIFAASETRGVLTAPVTGASTEYKVELARIDAGGVVIQAGDTTIAVTPGGDVAVEPRCGTLRITTETLPRGKVGRPFSAQMEATGALGLVTWSNPNATLPPGLSINPQSGLISGTPTVESSRLIAIVATSGPDTTSRSYQIVIDPTLTITTTSVPNADSGRAYTASLQASNFTTTPTWSLASGTLPPGIALGSGGVLSGTPTQSGTFSFRVQASADGDTAERELQIVVRGALPFTVRVEMRAFNFVAIPFLATVVADRSPFVREDTGGACVFDSRRDGTFVVRCSLSLPRGSSATFTVQTMARWLWLTPGCGTAAACTVLFDDPNPGIRSRNVSLDFNQ